VKKRLVTFASVALMFGASFLIVTSASTRASATADQSTPMCNSNNLLGAYAGSQSGAGGSSFWIALIDIGSSSCRLSGYPQILGINRSRLQLLPIAHHGSQYGNPTPLKLSFEKGGFLILGTGSDCNALNTTNAAIKRNEAKYSYSDLYIVLPGRNGRVMIPGATIDIACGLSVSRLGQIVGRNYP
jgi:hypothetical protein